MNKDLILCAIFYALVVIFFRVVIILKNRKAYVKLHKLYKILYETIAEKDSVRGLCLAINDLYLKERIISIEELYLLNDHFSRQKPKFYKHIKFYYNKNFSGRYYWWRTNSNIIIHDSVTKQRKLFIKMLINKTHPIKMFWS